jgi:hypothetical protein
VSIRQQRPEYLYFSPVRLDLIGSAAAIAVVAISCFALVKARPEIQIFAQRLRTAAMPTADPERGHEVPEWADTAMPTSLNSTPSSWDRTEASIPGDDAASERQAVNSEIRPVDRHLKGAEFWAAHEARVKAITALVHERWERGAVGH